MEIILALVFGAAVGAAIHFALPHRALRGRALAPVLGTVVAGLAWLALTWAGIGTESPWPWLSAIVLPAAVTAVAVTALTRARLAHDARERARLGIG